MKIFTGPLSMFGAKVQIAALEKGIHFETIMVPFDANDSYQPKHPEVLRVNPKRQVPVLIDGDVELFDSTQIFEYLEDRVPDPPLWPAAVAERAAARLLEHKSDEVFFPHVIRLMGLQNEMQSAPAVDACAACAHFYGELEQQLVGKEFLAGAYGFADIAFFMAHVFAHRKGAGMRPATPGLVAWRDRVGERPAVRQGVGPLMRFLASQGRAVPDFLQSLA